MRTWQPHTTRVGALAFSPDGQYLATTAGQSKLVWLWDAGTGRLVRKLAGHDVPARAVAFSPDGRFLAAMQAGPNINVWEVEAGKLAAALALQSGGSKSLAFSPDGTTLVAAHWPGVCQWANPVAPAELSPRPADVRTHARQIPERVGFSPSGRLVVASRGTVNLAESRDDPARAFPNPVGWAYVNEFAFTRDEDRLGVAYGSRTAAVWNLTCPGHPSALLKGHKGKEVRAIGFTRDGATAITVGNDGTSRFWDAVTGAELRVFDWGVGVLSVAAFAPDGLTCAAGGDKGQVIVWDIDW